MTIGAFPQELDGHDDGPLVSIIFPVYDVEDEYIQRALRSVVEQTYAEIEVIIIDSSQKDWLRQLGEKCDWISYNYQKPQGISKARNIAIEISEGKIIAILDADDEYSPEKTKKQVEKLQGDTDMVYSDEFIVNENGELTRLSSLNLDGVEAPHIKFFRQGDAIPNLTVAVKKSCFKEEKFWEELEAREDPHLWVRLLRKYDVERISEPLAYKYLRSDSLTSNPDMVYENEKKSIEDLVERFDELEEYREERLQNAKYRYGKQLFHADRMKEARRVFISLLVDGFLDYRLGAMLLVSYLPFGNKAAFQSLQRLNEKAKRVIG
jgi:glycosyltransferase involved in cell wall biosynthesis